MQQGVISCHAEADTRIDALVGIEIPAEQVATGGIGPGQSLRKVTLPGSKLSEISSSSKVGTETVNIARGLISGGWSEADLIGHWTKRLLTL